MLLGHLSHPAIRVTFGQSQIIFVTVWHMESVPLMGSPYYSGHLAILDTFLFRSPMPSPEGVINSEVPLYCRTMPWPSLTEKRGGLGKGLTTRYCKQKQFVTRTSTRNSPKLGLGRSPGEGMTPCSEEAITSQAITWNPPGLRQRGKPRNTWQRHRKTRRRRIAPGEMERMATDRHQCHSLVDCPCSQ